LKPFAQRFILSCAFVSIACTAAVMPTQAAAVDTVKIQVNDELVQFPDAQPFIDGSSTLQVPLRLLSEKLGYQVDWRMEGAEVKVSLTNQKQAISLQTGAIQAIVNGKTTSLEGSAVFKDGRAYVPLRFISETFGSPISWDNPNWLAIVQADGKVHKSAWVAPAPATTQATAPAQVTTQATAQAPAPAQTMTDQIVQTANTFIGVPYVWGGTTPRGFDCSGFVRYVFQEKGIELPRTSVQMHSQAGTPVTDLQVGDLVFFKGSVNHVGIYLGNDQFISATSSRGVKIDSLSSRYWGARYIGAKRVL
jgi:peptidoglycan endopeptidase LytE